MRISRQIQLNCDTGTIHLYWRCHNKEFYLKNDGMKLLYLNTIMEYLPRSNQKISAFCVMNNHYHQISKYENSSIHLSNYMRRTHGSFGMKYNILHKRSGKVAESRPKTTLIQNIRHEMNAHFYIEANPIRAGICKLEELVNYKFSSYRYYAHGIRDNYTELISEPDWYLDLADTPKQRQREYRKLFKSYLFDYGPHKTPTFNSNLFYYGDSIWVREQEYLIKKAKKQNTS